MLRLSRTVTIHAPAEDVFAFIADPTRLPDWIPSLVEVVDIAGSKRHTSWKWVYKMAGMRFEGRAHVDKYEAPERLVVKSDGEIDSRWVVRLREADDHTKVRLTVDYAPPRLVLGKLAEPLVRLQNEEEAELALSRLRELVELEVPQRRVREVFAQIP